MKTEKEILDEFGNILIRDVHDFNSKLLKNIILHLIKKDEILSKLDFLCKETLESILFNFLKIFEENENFKLIYEENGKQVNLVEISEMLKAEPIIKNGWIDRFSKFAKDDDAT